MQNYLLYRLLVPEGLSVLSPNFSSGQKFVCFVSFAAKAIPLSSKLGYNETNNGGRTMKTVILNERIGSDGSLTLTDLPPDQDVMVVVQPRNGNTNLADDWAQWFVEVRQTHDFASMTREEILEVLRRTREEVARELYGD